MQHQYLNIRKMKILKPFLFTTLSFYIMMIAGAASAQSFDNPVSEMGLTRFIPTLEHTIAEDSNVVYCATLPLAWDRVRTTIGSPLQIPDNARDLRLLNDSRSYLNSLKHYEYQVSTDISGSLINVQAQFKLSLPFFTVLRTFQDRLAFKGEKVESFGVAGDDQYDQKKQMEILYYENNDHFVIKLTPSNSDHEIILYMPNTRFNTMADAVAKVNGLIAIGQQEKLENCHRWNYQFEDAGDIVIIPKIQFDLSTHFSSLEGNTFIAGNEAYKIKTVWQRTAFQLDESGAEIESESTVDILEFGIKEIDNEPKVMEFNKPFFVFLRRKDAAVPYFAAWLYDTELMIKE